MCHFQDAFSFLLKLKCVLILKDEIFNMDDVSDVWGGSGVSPTSERRGSDVRSTDSRVRGRRKQKERSLPVQPVLENKPLLPGTYTTKSSLN